MPSIANLSPAQQASLRANPGDWKHVVVSKDDHGLMHAVTVDDVGNSSRRAQKALRDRFAEPDRWGDGFVPKLKTLQVVDGLREYVEVPT